MANVTEEDFACCLGCIFGFLAFVVFAILIGGLVVGIWGLFQ